MKRKCKRILIKMLAVVCSTMLLFLSPCAKYIDAKSIDKVYAIPIAPALGGEAAGAALEFLIAVLASIAAGEIVIEHPESLLSPFAVYVANNYGDSIDATCMNIYNKATGTIESISWGELIDSLSDVHDFTVDNLTDLYAQYCPALLKSFEDFVTDVLNGDEYVSGLSDMLIDYATFTEEDIIAQRQWTEYTYSFNVFEHYEMFNYKGEINSNFTANFFGSKAFVGPVAGYFYKLNDGKIIDYNFTMYSFSELGSISIFNTSLDIVGTFNGEPYRRSYNTSDYFFISDHLDSSAYTNHNVVYSPSANFPIFTDMDVLNNYLRTGEGYEDAVNFGDPMYNVIDLTDVPDLAPDIPPFTRAWQQKEWERIANAPDVIGIGSYGHGVYDDNWGDDIPWIGLESLQEYSHSLLDIYNQIIDDILNGTYDSTEDIPGTYSEAWEQALSEAWDSIVEQSTDAVPGEKDKPTDGDEDEKDDPEGGGGNGGSNNDQEEPPEGGDENNENTGNTNLSKGALNHAAKKHMPSKFVQQLGHLSREAAENKISSRTFFNLKWTEEQVIEALTLGYEEALSNGYVSGTYIFTYLGESIVIALENGRFETGFGLHSYTYDELYELFLLLGGE